MQARSCSRRRMLATRMTEKFKGSSHACLTGGGLLSSGTVRERWSDDCVPGGDGEDMAAGSMQGNDEGSKAV